VAFISAAMQQVLENLTELPSSTGAEEIDLIFLKGIMENPIVKSLAKVYWLIHTITKLVLQIVFTEVFLILLP
jgi:hypothetical protein